MPITEKHIRICAGLYEIRDTMRRFFGDRYAGALQPYEKILLAAAAKKQCDTLHACLEIVEGIDGMPSSMFIAAAVELAEREARG
jgi:hypothetical protein